MMMMMMMMTFLSNYLSIYEEKLKKPNNPKFDGFIEKVDIECFGCNNFLQDIKFMKSIVIYLSQSCPLLSIYLSQFILSTYLSIVWFDFFV